MRSERLISRRAAFWKLPVGIAGLMSLVPENAEATNAGTTLKTPKTKEDKTIVDLVARQAFTPPDGYKTEVAVLAACKNIRGDIFCRFDKFGPEQIPLENIQTVSAPLDTGTEEITPFELPPEGV